MSPATLAWLSAFLFTQAVEVPVYFVALGRACSTDASAPIDDRPARIAAAFGASLITHPIVWFVFPRLPFRSYEGMVVGAETFAIVAEGLYFALLGAMPIRWAFLWSLGANLTSVTLGLTSRSLFGWP
ncbi:Hypothetical protein A7982_04090 [Minicystis rosea]|nr:Hypothetical protein A7982_04090 [Minicystis rosea]